MKPGTVRVEASKGLARPEIPQNPHAVSELTADRLRELLDYNPETGEFTRRVSIRQYKAGEVAGGPDSSGHISITLAGRRYGAHRLVWLHVHGEWPPSEVDHINGDKTDNRLANLRVVDQGVNQQNIRAALKNNKLGVLGVRKNNRGRPGYIAAITVNRVRHYFGPFETVEDASRAYLDAKRRLHVGCTI